MGAALLDRRSLGPQLERLRDCGRLLGFNSQHAVRAAPVAHWYVGKGEHTARYSAGLCLGTALGGRAALVLADGTEECAREPLTGAAVRDLAHVDREHG